MFTKCLQPNQLLEKPKLHYFPIAGRGELSKLIAVVGELDLVVENYQLEPQNEEALYKKKASELGFHGCGLPLLQHGNLTINQSGAIQDYLANIGQNYPKLTPNQKAVDDLFSHTLEDAISAAAKVVFQINTPETLPPVLDKLVGVLDKFIPDSGFIHGLDKPTKADLSILVLLEAKLPFGVASTTDNKEKYPRLNRLVEDVKQYPKIRHYLQTEGCTLQKGI